MESIPVSKCIADEIDDVDHVKSVKHLTCFYWHKYGKCSKADAVCLYAHYNTGHLAEEPMHMVPGRKH